MRLRLALLTCLVALIITPPVRADSSGLEFDHFWVVVQPNAPERAGLRISPNVNHNDGQGTSSISAEFFNSYIELMWLDPAVPVAPGAEKGVEKFKQRMRWRESGWCPIGIALHRTAANVTVPFPTWSFSAAWMPAGSAIEILIARDDKTSPSFSIEPPVFAVDEAANRKIPKSDPKAMVFAHPIAVDRVTGDRFGSAKHLPTGCRISVP